MDCLAVRRLPYPQVSQIFAVVTENGATRRTSGNKGEDLLG